MAYPFAPTLTYAAFKDRLQQEFHCSFKKVNGKLKDPQGSEHTVYYFEREHEGKTYRAVAPDLFDDAFVLFSVIRSLCTRLRIDPANFGLDLG